MENSEPEIKKGIYKHFKNKKEYRVLGIARHTETEEYLVLYQALYEGAWAEYMVRPYEMFVGKAESPETGEMVERFQFVREE